MLGSVENFLTFQISCNTFYIWPQNTDNGSPKSTRTHLVILSTFKQFSFLSNYLWAKAFRIIHLIPFLVRIKFPIFLFKQQQVCVIESLWRVCSVHDTRTVFSCNELIFTKNWSDVIFCIAFTMCRMIYVSPCIFYSVVWNITPVCCIFICSSKQ